MDVQSNFTILKTLVFTVVDSIQEPATNLNITAENVEK